MSLLNPWLILAVLAVMGGTYLVGYGNGYGNCKSENILAENKNLEAINEIRNRNIDDVDLINILRSGKF